MVVWFGVIVRICLGCFELGCNGGVVGRVGGNEEGLVDVV